jgi:hypothetical protein
MFFGSTSFSQSAFSDVGVLGNRAVVIPNGSRINISIGNLGPIPDVLIVPTGTQLNLASSTPSVISWNPIPPGVTQIWVPIDPDA